MSNEDFRRILADAIAGDKDALAELFQTYMPLIDKFSYINGQLDEDLRQCILIEIFKSISNFKIF